MKKLFALLALSLALQACGGMDYRPKVSAAEQDVIIEAIRRDNAEMAMYLETLQTQYERDSGLIESVFNLAIAGAAFANPASGVTSGVSILLALSGIQGLGSTPEQPVTIIYQGQENAGERTPFEMLMAYHQAAAELAAYDGSLAQAVMEKYAGELGMSGLHAALTEGISSPNDLQGMCMGLAALGSQAETIYDSLKVPESLATDPGDDAKPLQASL